MIKFKSLADIVKEQQNEIESLNTKLNRTVDATYCALLEMSAWLGIPDKKRTKQIKYLMENVNFCAEHDLRHLDKRKST